MSFHHDSDTDNPWVIPEREPNIASSNHQEAFCRIILYLKALHIPEEKARKIAVEALKRSGSSNGDPVVLEAMRALRELLIEQLPLVMQDSSIHHDSFLHENMSGLKSMPPVNRGFMVPAALDLIPWRTALVRSLKKSVSLVSRPINFLIIFIFLIILFVLLTFWK